MLVSALFCFWLEFITTLFCDPPQTFDFETVFSNHSELSSINGQVIDWHHYGNATALTSFVNAYPATDLSANFPLFMQLRRPLYQPHYSNRIVDQCIARFNMSAQADNWLHYKLEKDSGYLYGDGTLLSCPLPGHRNKTGAPCFDSTELNRLPKNGALKYEPELIKSNFSSLPYKGAPHASAYVILGNSVLDITDYLLAVTNIVKVAKGAHSRSFALDRMFLPLDLTILLFTNMGQDITTLFENMHYDDNYKQCLDQFFFHGVVAADAHDEGCARMNVALWITMGIFLMYFLLKINLANLTRLPFLQRWLFKSSAFALSERHLPPFTLLFVPCYAEPSQIIRQTFDSLARTSYPDTRKLLFFVCDGLATSATDGGKETWRCILESLGYSSTKDPPLRPYLSLGRGPRRINYAKVYAGFYESAGNRVPFLMVVKVGSLRESEASFRVPGNRGKRDSMLIALGFLERCMDLSHHRISPLEFELFNQCYNLLGIDPRCLKYMLVTDADTQVKDDVVVRMVARLEADRSLMAVNGHVRPANPEENIVTMLQIFPIYLSFYSGLAYEACLGSIATIHGGFIMYKLWDDKADETPLHSVKWSKTSDDIQEMEDFDSSSDEEEEEEEEEDGLTTTTTTTTTASSRHMNKSRRRRHHHRPGQHSGKKTTMKGRPISLAPGHEVQAICISPTVLRGLAVPRATTMHMENVLLLGEDQYFGSVLLRSHPRYRIGFEPEAIAYTTIPTNFFAMQALQLRSLRSTFHNLMEFIHMAKDVGFKYWITSFTKLIDLILSMPIIVYLYGVYIRYFVDAYQVYAIIAGAFTGLIILHVFYFVIRRQFKYVVWFIIYGLFSVPIFNIYFPVLAAWRSDDAYQWYDVWPTERGYGSRLHGIVTDPKEQEEHEEEEEDGEEVVRMRLSDFEVSEAHQQAQREKEQVELLDAKFNGFTAGYVHAKNKPSWSSSSSWIPSPPLAQTRERHSRLASEEDARFLTNHSTVSSHKNPFSSVLDDPFDDAYSAFKKQHRPSHSQSSYVNTNSHFADSFAPAMTTEPIVQDDFVYKEESSDTISLTNSVMESQPSPPPPIDVRGRRRIHHHHAQDEGRSAPVHSRFVTQHHL
ncbi:hypothetical protein INT47_010884 [Mucor saturninus]|uniref:chitin synthase n=1 Tax=Mucor saturninus TaxID=64648 RepID=A0A8H7RCN8_9FUNG|nr:hypothetical protein INT47_010884 [Mucor saturninus]